MSKRSKDKWKIKKWYEILSPPPFGEVEIGSTISDDPSKLLGRTIEVSLFDITKDFSHQYTLLYFQVVKVEGSKGRTMFQGHELLKDYIRSLIRRRSTKIDFIMDVTTKDGYKLRLSTVMLTNQKTSTSRSSAIRSAVHKVAEETAKKSNFEEIAKAVVYGNMNELMTQEAKKVEPLRFLAVFKSILIESPLPVGGKSSEKA